MEEVKRERSVPFEISIGIPAYNRSSELVDLLQSIYAQSVLPTEITICEDRSPERAGIRAVVDAWRDRFAVESCQINYHENERNLGYDGNVREVISVSRSPWVMLMGNDDLLMPGCIEAAASFIAAHPEVPMISRTFVMFKGSLQMALGTSCFSSEDLIYSPANSSPAMVFRTAGFVGGLIVRRDWATTLATDKYDGTLYYQIYLGAVAFCQQGIGYIGKPIVGSRVGNPPLFGAAASEKGLHVPGSYTPKGRAEMWASVLRIADDVGREFGVDLRSALKTELEVRQSFHIFEMMAGAGRPKLAELRLEFKKLGLFSHPLPRTLFLIDFLLGSRAGLFYRTVRRFRGSVNRLRAFTSAR